VLDPDPMWKLWRRKKSLAFVENETSTVQNVTHLHTTCVI
jgi:hypothetical protein